MILPANRNAKEFIFQIQQEKDIRNNVLTPEGKMWFDIIRTRKVRNDLTKQCDNFVGDKTVYGKTFTEKNLLFPIPRRETDNNKSLVQNPGF